MRYEQESRVANQIYRDSRRPLAAKLVMVPSSRNETREEAVAIALGRKRKRNTMRAMLVRPKARPVTWKEARARARAYIRVLESRPKWPSAKEAEELKAYDDAKRLAARTKVEKFRKPEKGMWWLDRFADAVDRRMVMTQPGYGTGAGARKRAKIAKKRGAHGL